MPEHLTSRQIERYSGRLMSPAELLAASDHFAGCEACRGQFKPGIRLAAETLQSDLRAQATSPNHLTYEESAAYVDECLDEVDRETVESHLDICSPCATEIADLRAFRAEMTTYPETAHAESESLTQRITRFWRAAGFRIPIQLAAAASVVLLCVLTVTILLRKETADKNTQLSELQQPNDTPDARPPQPAETQHTPEPNVVAAVVDEIRDGGSLVTLDKEGNVTGLESLPLPYRQAIKAGIANKRVERPSTLEGLAGRTGVLMGGGSEGSTFSLIGPIGTVVKTDRPAFRWQALLGATSYTIAVYDPSFNKVTSSQQQPGTEWTPPQPLARGELYTWQVTATREGKEIISPAPPAPGAKFRVLDPATVKELDRAKKTYAGSHLILGMLYERAGLLDDAEREFKTLAGANPKSQTVRKLLRDVRSLRQPR